MATRPMLGDPLPDRWKKEIARALLAEWRASGRSLAQFARDRGLRADRLRWWKKQFSNEEQARRRPRVGARPTRRQRFIPAIATVPATVRGAERVIVRLPNGLEVEATSADLVPPAWLAALARAVGA